MNDKTPKEGDLKVWWIPQIPMKPFEQPVQTPLEGAVLCRALALYDLFQFENNVKPDYSNAGGLQVFEDGEWIDWYDDETGDDFNEWMDAALAERQEVAMSEEAKPIVEVLDRQTGEITTVGASPMLMGVRLRINYDHSVYQAVRKIAGEPVTLEGCGDQKYHYTTGAGRRFTATVKMGKEEA